MCLNRTTRANYVNTTPTLRHIDQLHTKFKKYSKTTPFWTEILMPKSGPCSRNRKSGAKHRVCTFLKSDVKVGNANVSFGPLLPLGPLEPKGSGCFYLLFEIIPRIATKGACVTKMGFEDFSVLRFKAKPT